jgi:pyruvate/2-oxoglutarate dehydrogenase complex dihydrolipoamide dehydrogenase (E3) component
MQGMLGGVCVHTGTIPSKTFREAVLHLTGYRHQGFYGRAYQPWRERISIPDLLLRVKKVESAETDVVIDQLRREGVEIISGTARFLDDSEDGGHSSSGSSSSRGEAPPRIAVLKTDHRHESESSAYR